MTHIRTKKGKILWVLVILILAFIFGQSFLNESTSSKESNAIKESVAQPIHETVTGNKKLPYNVRDAAHVVEFTALGLGMAVLLKNKNPVLNALRSVSYCGMIALVDESIQFLSDRAPQVKDIWHDILGGAIGTVIGVLLIIVVGWLRNGKSGKKND